MNKYSCAMLIGLIACQSPEVNNFSPIQPFSKGYISFHISENMPDTVEINYRISTIIPNNVKQENKTYFSPGDFTIEFEKDRASSDFIGINDKWFNILTVPNDTIHIHLDFEKTRPVLSFSGNHAEINEFYLDKTEKLGYLDMVIELNNEFSTGFNVFKSKADALMESELQFLDTYKKNLPDWFKSYETNSIRYGCLGIKCALPVMNPVFNHIDGSVPEDYYEFLEGVKINNEEAITAGRYYLFLNYYFNKDTFQNYDSLSGLKRITTISNDHIAIAKKELTGDALKYYQLKTFAELIPHYSDSLEIARIADQYQIENYEQYLSISGTRLKKVENVLDLQPGDKIPNFFVTNTIDSLISIRDFETQVVYINFWQKSCKPCVKNIPALNNMIESYAENDKVAFLNISLDSDKATWESALEKYDLKGINVFPEGNWGKKLRSYFNVLGVPQYNILSVGNKLYERDANKAPYVREQIDKALLK